jgi:hypothetical protein
MDVALTQLPDFLHVVDVVAWWKSFIANCLYMPLRALSPKHQVKRRPTILASIRGTTPRAGQPGPQRGHPRCSQNLRYGVAAINARKSA